MKPELRTKYYTSIESWMDFISTPHPAFNNLAPCPWLSKFRELKRIKTVWGSQPREDVMRYKAELLDNNFMAMCIIYPDAELSLLQELADWHTDDLFAVFYSHPLDKTYPQGVDTGSEYPVIIIQHQNLLELACAQSQRRGYPPR